MLFFYLFESTDIHKYTFRSLDSFSLCFFVSFLETLYESFLTNRVTDKSFRFTQSF